MLSTHGLEVDCFESPTSFLAQGRLDKVGCLLLDVQMPEMTGLELQRALASRPSCLPIIFLTAHGTIPMTVEAMKNGAFEFLEKPVSEEVLLEAIGRALERSQAMHDKASAVAALENRFSTLTPREREVFTQVVIGRLNKQIAADLGIAEKTVKVHRSRVMEKLQAASVADLVRCQQALSST